MPTLSLLWNMTSTSASVLRAELSSSASRVMLCTCPATDVRSSARSPTASAAAALGRYGCPQSCPAVSLKSLYVSHVMATHFASSFGERTMRSNSAAVGAPSALCGARSPARGHGGH